MTHLTTNSRLKECERIIERTKASAWEFVKALREIKDDQLWKEAAIPTGEAEYANFDDYAQRRFGFGRNYANRLIKGLDVIESVPIGTELNEGQARELAKVPKDDREKVLDWAAEKAEGKPFTAKAIREAAAEVLEAEPEEEDDEEQTDYDDFGVVESHEHAEPEPDDDAPQSELENLCEHIEWWQHKHDKGDCVMRALLESVILTKY
jgi:hypothetical protein